MDINEQLKLTSDQLYKKCEQLFYISDYFSDIYNNMDSNYCLIEIQNQLNKTRDQLSELTNVVDEMYNKIDTEINNIDKDMIRIDMLLSEYNIKKNI